MTTQMEIAKKGEITPEMRLVAKEEQISEEKLRKRIAEGTVIITKNAKRENVHPIGIGKG